MLQVKNISFTYIDNPVIQNLSFEIAKGQNVALIGESGCGKSTLLKLLYGLYNLDHGEIFYNGKPILGPKYNLIPGEDYIKYLAQDFDLMPYITVEENVGKYLSNIYKAEKKARVQELLEMVEMTDFAKEKAKYLRIKKVIDYSKYRGSYRLRSPKFFKKKQYSINKNEK
jgi:ABC-type multidrug transport system ATPase subunit